jgi:hypothetical protein
VEVPETRYAKTADGVYIAYQTVGNGPLDLVLVCYLLHIEHIWTWPVAASFLRRLATFSRLILAEQERGRFIVAGHNHESKLTGTNHRSLHPVTTRR